MSLLRVYIESQFDSQYRVNLTKYSPKYSTFYQYTKTTGVFVSFVTVNEIIHRKLSVILINKFDIIVY